MERQRRCGFLPPRELGRERVIWSRGGVSTTTCPNSCITPLSQALIEQYAAWKVEGHRELISLPVRKADAFVVLEEERKKEEESNGER